MVHKITVSSHCRNKNATHRVKSLHSHLHGKEQLTPFQWIQHWFIVIHIKTIGSLSSTSKQLVYCHPIKTIGSLSSISKQLSSNGFTTASASQAIKWPHTLVHCHPYQNNWFIVIHVKTLVTQWIHHCFNQMDSYMIHTSSNEIPCTTTHLDHTSKRQVFETTVFLLFTFFQLSRPSST